jgi:hypothetical protein
LLYIKSRLVGAAPAKSCVALGGKNKNGSNATHLKISVRAAGRNLADAEKAFKALSQAVATVQDVCNQIDKFVPQTSWQAALDEGLGSLRSNDCVSAALRAAANPSFDAKEGDLTELSAREVKQLIHHLMRAEKVMALSSALLTVKSLCQRVDAATENKDLLHWERLWATLRDPAASVRLHSLTGAAELNGKIGKCTSFDARTERWAVRLEDGEVKNVKTSNLAILTPQELLQHGIELMLPRECVQTTLREVAPDVYAARETNGLKELTLDEAKALRDGLERLKSADKMAAAWSPMTLVRAVRELYLADSLEDAEQTLERETADEIELRKLAERTAEFVPALAALREKAVDREILEVFRNQSVSIAGADVQMQKAEMETEECCTSSQAKSEAQPVELPEGWKLQWVSQIRKDTKDQYRFVDPAGRKYFSVVELRTAISSGFEAVQEMRRLKQEARQLTASDKPVVAKKTRLGSFGGRHRKKSRW